MNVDVVYQICQFAINKNQNGYLSPDDFNLVINQGQLSYSDYLLGEFQQYQYGSPVARVEFGQNEVVRQRLTPLIESPSTLTIDGTGFSPYPANFQQVDAIYTSATPVQRIRYVQQHKLYSYVNSQIDPVATNPIYLIRAEGIQFYPITLGTALISYVRTPATIKWDYITDANGLPIYAAGNSVDPDWYDVDLLSILVRALALVGVNLQAAEIAQYSQMIKTQGD